jgi:glycosyltransferase involved in cell wall biosynthesis
MADNVTVTVILCTYNRCQSLAKALASVAESVMPEATDWEVLVVDNNSKDDTRQVVLSFATKYPGRFRYLFEPQPGKSYALNSGIAQAYGDTLAFMDDDVTVEPTWLNNLTARLEDGEWAGSGGRILPEQTFQFPNWLSLENRYALAPLALFDLGQEAGVLNESPFGTNMAFQKRIFAKHGAFRTDLGPRPDSEIRNEDTEFGRRLLAKGERLRYEPSAIVYHSVSENRVRKQYFLTWWFDKARADIRQFGVSADAKWFVGGVPLRMFRRLALWVLRWLVAVDPRSRFSKKINVWGVAGQITECYRQPRGRKAAKLAAE